MRIISSGSIEGRPEGAVKRRQVLTQAAEIKHRINSAQHVVGGDMAIPAELVEQLRLNEWELPIIGVWPQ